MILPGVTRDSVLALAQAHIDPNNPLKLAGLSDKLVISERNVTMPEVVKASKDGTLLEMFGCGTVNPPVLLAMLRRSCTLLQAAVVSCIEGVGSVPPSRLLCAVVLIDAYLTPHGRS
jgi:branched-chain amino acid aminotransferase